MGVFFIYFVFGLFLEDGVGVELRVKVGFDFWICIMDGD